MPTTNILALDVGERRIGVAVGDTAIKIPIAKGYIEVNGNEIEAIKDYVRAENPALIVVGFPRNQSGEPTAQTEFVQNFANKFKQSIQLPIVFQDESLTSVLAEENLKRSKKPYFKGDIDSEAARIILGDYLEQNYA